MKLEKVRQQAADNVDSLKLPESIRTPGRTWTTYPEVELDELEDFEPKVNIQGDAEVFTGEEAADKAGENFMDSLKPTEDKLSALHASNMNSIIYVKASGKASVEIVYETDRQLLNHVVVETERGAELDITEEFRGSGDFVTSFNEIYAGENSTVNYGAIQSLDAEFFYSRKKAVLNDFAEVNWLNSNFGSELARTKIETVLKGDGTETGQLATWYSTEEQHHDTSLQVRHLGEDTKCQMDSRAVVDDSARSVYEGLQRVEEVAEDTSSFQDEEVLILSDKAEVDASPKLMIENPDVEASHAASTGSIDDKKQHYIESRGLNDGKAEKLIVKGFFEPVLEEIELPELKEKVREEVRKKLAE